MTEFSAISKQLTASLSKTTKKEEGIYFTPPAVVNLTIDILCQHLASTTVPRSSLKILEPSCGSGEYISALRECFDSSQIVGIEKNPTIYQRVYDEFHKENVQIVNADYLKTQITTKYDVIVGNPPFYVMKKDNVDKKYHEYFDGRPNIFILFIVNSLWSLKENGILSFILPKNFLNCLYYDKTRKYLASQCEILNIIECSGSNYIDTQQETVIFIVKKRSVLQSPPSAFILSINDHMIFSTEENIQKYKELYEGSTTLSALGFHVSVGNVVWNQCKSILTNDETHTRLIYSSDVETGEYVQKKYKNVEKKNYIQKGGGRTPMIVVNRGYGVGTYKFYWCLLDDSVIGGGGSYLVENHLICITFPGEDGDCRTKYEKILCSFKDDRTKTFIDIYFGNNAINTTELLTILPIYQDI